MQNDAIQVAETRDAEMLRNFLIKRVIYALENAEDPTAFEALDADTGAIPQALSWHETIWWLDPDDTTTPHDGVTTLVTDDAYRYKANGISAQIRSVIDKDVADPSTLTPALGDTYLVPAGAIGDWSSNEDDVALYTQRGWVFASPQIGWYLYVEDEDAYYRYSASGAWAPGAGAHVFTANSVPVSAIINGGRTTFIVENQTTNAPPSSPSAGVAYIIGSSPTGAWSGKAGQVAVCEATGTWSYYSPSNGYQAYDKSTNNAYRYNGSAWLSANGVWVAKSYLFTQGTGSTTVIGTTNYTYSPTTAPTTSNRRHQDTLGIHYTAKAVGSGRLRIRYSCVIKMTDGGSGSGFIYPSIALFRDSETNAIAWSGPVLDSFSPVVGTNIFIQRSVEFFVDVADTSDHAYTPAVITGSSGDINVSLLSHRLLTIEEAS